MKLNYFSRISVHIAIFIAYIVCSCFHVYIFIFCILKIRRYYVKCNSIEQFFEFSRTICGNNIPNQLLCLITKKKRCSFIQIICISMRLCIIDWNCCNLQFFVVITDVYFVIAIFNVAFISLDMFLGEVGTHCSRFSFCM